MRKAKILLPLLITVGSISMGYAQKEKKTNTESGKLVHMVFFKLKPDADKQTLINSIETFKKVAVIKNVEIGLFEDTHNPKTTLSEHTIIMRLTFESSKDFKIYETHPVHLASIEATKALMAAPPIGYDYIIR